MTQDRTRSSLELLLNISRELAASIDLHKVLSRVLFLSVRDVEAERASLIVLDSEQQPIDAAIVTGDQLHSHTVEQLQITLQQGLAGWVLRQRQPAFVPDTSRDERWLRLEDDDVERTGPKSAICIPLMAQEELVGILTIVHSEPGFFTQDHLTLLQAIADLFGIAIRNARLYASMQAAQRRYHELFEDSIDPIVLTNWKGIIVEANRQMAAFTNSNVDELKEHTIMELHDVSWEKVGESFEHLKTGETVSYESQAQFGSNPAHPVQVYVRKATAGDADYLQWILRDISERKELDALREDLMAMIYHDLRSPLSNIVSSLDILNSMLPSEDTHSIQPVFQIAVRSTERMQRLINSLLDINRLEAGQPPVNVKPILPYTLVTEAAEAVQPIIEGKQQALSVTVSPALPPVMADMDMIRRVLINLLENATKFTPLRSNIEIGSRIDGQVILFWVEDSGPGIPQEAHETIFLKFNRLQPANSPKGFGLGLAFCRLAVEAHGGKIWVEDREETGSRFVFHLPVVESVSAPVE